MHSEGIDMVVARLEMAFQLPLKSGDTFVSCLNLSKQGIKYVFEQEIYRLPDYKRSIKALVTSVALVNGKLSEVKKIDDLIS
jgi:acyl-CoA thioester hydrolase